MQRVHGDQQRSRLPLLYRLPTRGKDRDARMTNELGKVSFPPSGDVGYIFIEIECPELAAGCGDCGVTAGINVQLPERLNDRRYQGWTVYIDREGALQVMDGDPNDG